MSKATELHRAFHLREALVGLAQALLVIKRLPDAERVEYIDMLLGAFDRSVLERAANDDLAGIIGLFQRLATTAKGK